MGHRQRQAQATRQQIGRAARRLFADRGYVATTIAAISEAADIPAQTIYSSMGSKAAILEQIAAAAVGELDVDRHHAEAIDDPDPAAGLRTVAALQRRQYEVMYDVIAIYIEAARSDPQIAAATAVIQHNREQGFRRHLAAIAAHLRPGLTIETAIDRYLAMVLPEIYRTLVIERGWTPNDYQKWLGETLVQQLLGQGKPASDHQTADEVSQ
jgi:AcrR family transcriptional regulator